jgi:hypothetical protein
MVEKRAMSGAENAVRHRVTQRRYRNSARGRRLRRARNYGITNEQFDALVIEQGGLCWICRDEMHTPHIDHDHETGRVRGLLCYRCNNGLGLFRDNPIALARAILYLLRSG